MERKNILVVGAKGQLGNELRFLSFRFGLQFQLIYVDKEELDITRPSLVTRFFERNHIDYCINCAAYTAVDKAETDIKNARKINVTAVKHLAKACAAVGAVLIQISTDYVYHNNQNVPFKEGDRTSPKSVYAKTKLEGERVATRYNPKTMIIRTSWLYSTFGHNFVRTMLRLGKERPEISVVFDQIGTPTYARDLALDILIVLKKVEEGTLEMQQLSGIYHYSNEGVTSWYDFAHAIFEIKELKCKVHPIESSAYPTPAKRPPFSALNKAKFSQTFGIEIAHWRDALKRCLSEL